MEGGNYNKSCPRTGFSLPSITGQLRYIITCFPVACSLQNIANPQYISGATPLFISSQIIEKMNGQGEGAEVIPFSVAVKAHGNIEEWLCDLLFKMQVLYLKFVTVLQ